MLAYTDPQTLQSRSLIAIFPSPSTGVNEKFPTSSVRARACTCMLSALFSGAAGRGGRMQSEVAEAQRRRRRRTAAGVLGGDERPAARRAGVRQRAVPVAGDGAAGTAPPLHADGLLVDRRPARRRRRRPRLGGRGPVVAQDVAASRQRRSVYVARSPRSFSIQRRANFLRSLTSRTSPRHPSNEGLL